MIPELAPALRTALAARGDVRLAILFGSAARGRDKPDSDLDVAVLAPNADLLAVAVDLMNAIHRDVDVVSLSDAGIPLLEQILEHGVLLYEAVPGEFAAFRSRALIDLETDRPWYARMRDAWLRRLAAGGLRHGEP